MEAVSVSGSGFFFPTAPRRGSETGLSRAFLLNLILKTLYYRQEMLGHEIAREIRLPFPVVDEYIANLRKEKLIEVAGAATSTTATYRYKISDLGRERAREARSIAWRPRLRL